MDVEKVASSPFVVGALGALVVVLRGVPGDTWLQKGANVTCGALVAGYFSPAFAEWVPLHTPAMQGACAFFFGLFGVNFVAAATALISNFVTSVNAGKVQLSDFIPWLRKRGD
jgi:hypothetical protein